MKKMIWLVALVGSLVSGLVVSAADGGGDPKINPLNIARAFALRTPDYYQGHLWCQMLVNGSFREMEMQFTMTKDYSITKLEVDGTRISLPEPIHGLPMGDGGLMKQVSLNINGMTKEGEYAGNGYTFKTVVSKGDNLTVALTPADIRQEIPIDVGRYGNDIQFILEDFTYGYGWGVDGSHFYVYVPPVGGRYHYLLRRWSTGEIIGEGWLEPFKQPVTADNAYVGVTYIGGVQEVSFPNEEGLDDWSSLCNVDLNCRIPTTEGIVTGKVVFADVGKGGLEIIVSGEYWVYIQLATGKDGDMLFYPLEDHSSSGDGWYETRVNTLGIGVGKAVITIIPKPGNTRNNPWINFHRFYSLSSNTGGKG
jgi:hypothetical protein